MRRLLSGIVLVIPLAIAPLRSAAHDLPSDDGRKTLATYHNDYDYGPGPSAEPEPSIPESPAAEPEPSEQAVPTVEVPPTNTPVPTAVPGSGYGTESVTATPAPVVAGGEEAAPSVNRPAAALAVAAITGMIVIAVVRVRRFRT
ncbi:MAG TPA: hypothetical protein VD862_03720 [Candidatus Paceibacterota bacterium]|nr:hypothetical protein [Candidatus Paceibacterota bacterium]